MFACIDKLNVASLILSIDCWTHFEASTLACCLFGVRSDNMWMRTCPQPQANLVSEPCPQTVWVQCADGCLLISNSSINTRRKKIGPQNYWMSCNMQQVIFIARYLLSNTTNMVKRSSSLTLT